MEISPRAQEREKASSVSSPRSNNAQIPSSPSSSSSPALIPRSDSSPYPTTFVQADTSSFKHVVQMLTGSSDSPKPPQDPLPSSSKTFPIPPMKKQGFKLYERRHNLHNSLFINTLLPNFHPNSGVSQRNPDILSPSLLDFPSLSLSPVTPLNDVADDPFEKSSSSSALTTSSEEEEKAIAEKGFYLHPSLLTTPRDSEPRLLPLFPVTSPRASESPS